MARKPKIDPMFILACKEEIAADEVVTIVLEDYDQQHWYERHFTDEELDSVRFMVGHQPRPAPGGGKDPTP
jgi:hypothetical protein